MSAASDSMPTDEPWAHLTGWDRTFSQMWHMFFLPEIEQRQKASRLEEGFSLYMAQVLFPPEGLGRVLLNEEISGDGLIAAPRLVEKGDDLYVSDLGLLERYELPDELLDNGHFTIVRSGQEWRIFFNFLSGRAKAADMLELAGQFLDTARYAHAQRNAGPAIDNLYSAAELTSKAELILHRSAATRSKTHGSLASAINAWAQLGNIDSAFVALFNTLGQQRPAARYGDRPHRPKMPDIDSLDLVAAMIDRGFDRIRKSTARESGNEKPAVVEPPE